MGQAWGKEAVQAEEGARRVGMGWGGRIEIVLGEGGR